MNLAAPPADTAQSDIARWLTALGAANPTAWQVHGSSVMEVGWPSGGAARPPDRIERAIRGLLEAVAVSTGRVGWPVRPGVAEVLAIRPRHRGSDLTGRVSHRGASRLLRCEAGWLAVTLIRAADRELLPAALQRETVDGDAWRSLEEAASVADAVDLAARLQLMGIPASALGWGANVPPAEVSEIGQPRELSGLKVINLGSLWAAPLCSAILMHAGAEVTKIESLSRPDRGRDDPDLGKLSRGHSLVTLDFDSGSGRARLAEILDEADIVIEASRRRARESLDLNPARWLSARLGRVWVALTGYGSAAPDRVAFGDDAAIGGGLFARDVHGDPVFVGDAIADPLTGLAAAAATAIAIAEGGARLVEIAMVGVSSMTSRPR